MQKSVAREREQADAVAIEIVDKVIDGELGAVEPVRLHILRQHAFGRVHRDQQFDALAMHFLPVETDLRTGQRDEQTRDAGDENTLFQPASPRGDRRGKLGEQAWRNEPGQGGALLPVERAVTPEQEEAGGQSREKPVRLCKVHNSVSWLRFISIFHGSRR